VENWKKGDRWEELGVGETIILRWIFQKLVGVVWNGLFYLRIGTSGGLLRM
jgi:hypothetical protein